MANKYGVVRTDRMLGTDAAPALISALYLPDDTATEIENGAIVKAVALAAETVDGVTVTERELYKAETPEASTAIDELALVASVELMYKDEDRALSDFINEAGKPIRCYRLHKHDIFSVTTEALDYTGTIAKGWAVFAGDQVKMKAAASAANGATKIGTVLDIETVGPYTYVVVEVA